MYERQVFADPKDVPAHSYTTIAEEWEGILNHPKHKESTTAYLSNLQKRFIQHVKSRDIAKDWDEDDYDEILDTVATITIFSPKFRGNVYEGEQFEHAMLNALNLFGLPKHVAAGIDESKIMESPEAFSPLAKGVGDQGIRLEEFEGVEPKKAPESIDNMSFIEAYQICLDAAYEHEQSLKYFSAEHFFTTSLPRAANLTLEFGAVAGAGVPLGLKTLQKGHPVIASMLASGQRLAAVELLNVEGWNEPKEKLVSSLKSFGIGAVYGGVRSFTSGPISALGTMGALMSTNAFVSAKIHGADTETALKSAFRSLEMLFAMEVVGGLQKKAKEYKAYKTAFKELTDTAQKNLGCSHQEAQLHAQDVVAGTKVNTLKKMAKPLLGLEKMGKLSPEQAKRLEMIKRQMKGSYKKAQKTIDDIDNFFVNKTVSKYPQDVKNIDGVRKAGSQMIQDFNKDFDLKLNDNKIFWCPLKQVTSKKGVKKSVIKSGTTFMTWNPETIKAASQATGILVDKIPQKAFVVGLDMHQSQGAIKKSMVKGLSHIARPPYETPQGRHEVQHKHFRDLKKSLTGALTETRQHRISAIHKAGVEEVKEASKERSKIFALQKKHGLTKDELDNHIRNVVGTVKPLAHLTSAELYGVTANVREHFSETAALTKQAVLGLTDTEVARIRKKTKSTAIYARVLSSEEQPLPTDDKFRRNQRVNRMRLDADLQQRYGKADTSIWRRITQNEKLTLLSPRNWHSSRYYFDWLSRATGEPLLELKEKTEESHGQGRYEQAMLGRDILKNMNMPERHLMFMSSGKKARIIDYLYTRTAKSKLALKGDEAAIASELNKALQGPVANWIRGTIWMRWNSAYSKVEPKLNEELLKEKPDMRKVKGWMRQIEKFVPEDVMNKDSGLDPVKLIKEGRAAKEAGTFDKWIASQQWGTRQIYYMSDVEWNSLTKDSVELLKAPSLESYEAGLKAANIDYNALHPRLGKNPLTNENPYLAVKQHAYRAATMYRMYDNFEKFNDKLNVISHRLHPQDKAAVASYRNGLLGIYEEPKAWTRFLSKSNMLWWEGYSRQPTRLAWFTARNLAQNIGMLPGQISTPEFLKATAKLRTGKRDPSIDNDFREYWNSTITQKRAMWETLTLSDVTGRFTGQGYSYLMNIGRHIIPWSDEVNRKIAWFPIRQLADDNVKAWRDGKISTAKLYRRLKIRTMAPEQQNRLGKLLDSGNDHEFVKWYSIEKVQNTHFVYDLFGRSILEQSPTNRIFMGLSTWPRGAIESYYQNAVKPIMLGIKLKDGARVYEGAKNLAVTAIGLTMARELLENTIGTKGVVGPYGSVKAMSWSPITPGASWILGYANIFRETAMYRAKGRTAAETADMILKKTSYQLEQLMPCVDAAIEVYKKGNDKEGVRFYHMVKQALTRYDIRSDNLLKDNYQGFADKFVTGFFGTTKKEEDIFK